MDNEGLSSEEIMVAVALILGIATLCQLLAPRLRVPALILLLPAGFIAGQVFPIMNAEEILGEAFVPLVNIVVAIILFYGGMELGHLPLDHDDAKVVRRLVWWGAPITWLGAAVGAYYLCGLALNISVLIGAILIVSGPTVVGPLLEFVRPERRLRHILSWEGILIDPLGALAAVVVFQGVKASDAGNVTLAVVEFLVSMLVGALAAVIGLALIRIGMPLSRGNVVAGTQVLLVSVVVAAALADYVADDSGLVAAVTMGMVTPFMVKEQLPTVRPFFDTIVTMSIGVLFVSISALVKPSMLTGLVLPTMGLVLLLIVVVRPLVAALATAGSPLTVKERIFVGWIAPRGIVAAASAASFTAALITLKVPSADAILPVTFMVIAGTVAIYGLTAVPVASWLGVRDPDLEESRERAAVDDVGVSP